MNYKTDSKKHCASCEHIEYCDKANPCNGECFICDDYECENNTNMRRKFDVSVLYTLCNKEQLFTCGSVEQYKKMFELARNGVTQTELAYILYICSQYRLDVIYNMITPLFKAKEGK